MTRQVLERARLICARDGITMQQLLEIGAKRLLDEHPLPAPPPIEMRLVIRRRDDGELRAPTPRAPVFTF